MTLSRLQRGLLSLNIVGVLLISYFLITQDQDWSKLHPASQKQPQQTTQTSSSHTDSPKTTTPNPTQLAPHSNHNNAATSYAYDVKEIQQYVTGAKPYTGGNLVFLTIDDGANNEVTPAILDILKEKGVPATFFPIGSEVTPDRAGLYKREIAEGHAIGMHSFSHNLDLLYPGRVPDTAQIVWEAKQADKAFKRVLGMKFNTHVWRYPGGALSWKGLETTHAALADLGLTWIDWNAYLGDAEPKHRRPQTLDEMITFHTRSLESFPNSPTNLKVVLMHDAKDKQLTIQALPYIIQYYKDNGYTFGVLE